MLQLGKFLKNHIVLLVDITLVLLKFRVLYLVRELKCQEVFVVNLKEKSDSI